MHQLGNAVRAFISRPPDRFARADTPHAPAFECHKVFHMDPPAPGSALGPYQPMSSASAVYDTRALLFAACTGTANG